MYLRVIRNREQKKTSYLRVVLVIISIFFVVKMLVNISFFGDKVANIKNKVLDVSGKMVYETYKFALENEYSLKTCRMDNIEIEETVVIFKENSNLYSYIEDNKKIQVVFGDPSYTYGNNGDTMLVSGKEDDNSDKEVINDNDEEIVSYVNGKHLEGYAPPAVSKEGIRYTEAQLSDFSFLMNKLYIVPARAKVLEEELNAKEMLSKDMALKQDNSKPQILIYHTHSQEGFADSVKGKPETYIVGVGDYLTTLLTEEYGYNVIHCREQFDIKGGTLDRSKAYTYAEESITQILEDNPTIEVVIDLHRDGLKEGAEKLVTTVDGKQVAKIMFFNGVSRSSSSGDIEYLYNRYKKDNLAFSFQLKLAAMECYPEYTRKNYIDAYQYNQHLRAKSILIEAGAQNNTLQEELNSMEVLAEILHKVLFCAPASIRIDFALKC